MKRALAGMNSVGWNSNFSAKLIPERSALEVFACIDPEQQVFAAPEMTDHRPITSSTGPSLPAARDAHRRDSMSPSCGIALLLADSRATSSTLRSCESLRVGIGLSPSSSVAVKGQFGDRVFLDRDRHGAPPGSRAITNTCASPRRRTREAKPGSSFTASASAARGGAAAGHNGGKPASCARHRVAGATRRRCLASTSASKGPRSRAAPAASPDWLLVMPRNQRERWRFGSRCRACSSIVTACGSKRCRGRSWPALRGFGEHVRIVRA